ncbi:MAG: hypothetical protein HY694_17885 [Deltaproteobacteria bacterium]|nr:hypothetical protein [Deltaproteobacteria bacterium]
MMTTQRDILKAVEGLPQGLLEQVKDFIALLKEKKGARNAPLPDKALAKKKVAAIK